MSIMDKLKKNSRLSKTDVLSQSRFYDEELAKSFVCPTEIPMMNVAFSGDLDGGMKPGILMIAGDSKHFKTGFMLECAKGFQNKHPDGVILFYDSERGAPISYFETRNINMDTILHCPIRDIEELKFDILHQLKLLEAEKIPCMVMIDSIGMLPSKREVDNAENENSAADMTRAKELNSLFRIITPYITFNDIPVVIINHAYDTMDNSHDKVISGGKKVYLAADDVWVIGRQKDGTGSDIKGFNFTINIDKSRNCIEKTKININSTFEKGINRNSGLLEEAAALGYAQIGAWCKIIDFDTGELVGGLRKQQVFDNDEWFSRLLKDSRFRAHIAEKYRLVK